MLSGVQWAVLSRTHTRNYKLSQTRLTKKLGRGGTIRQRYRCFCFSLWVPRGATRCVCVKWASLVLPAVLWYDAHMTTHSTRLRREEMLHNDITRQITHSARTLFSTMKSFVDTHHYTYVETPLLISAKWLKAAGFPCLRQKVSAHHDN
jgi:hypothetical protein